MEADVLPLWMRSRRRTRAVGGARELRTGLVICPTAAPQRMQAVARGVRPRLSARPLHCSARGGPREAYPFGLCREHDSGGSFSIRERVVMHQGDPQMLAYRGQRVGAEAPRALRELKGTDEAKRGGRPACSRAAAVQHAPIKRGMVRDQEPRPCEHAFHPSPDLAERILVLHARSIDAVKAGETESVTRGRYQLLDTVDDLTALDHDQPYGACRLRLFVRSLEVDGDETPLVAPHARKCIATRRCSVSLSSPNRNEFFRAAA